MYVSILPLIILKADEVTAPRLPHDENRVKESKMKGDKAKTIAQIEIKIVFCFFRQI